MSAAATAIDTMAYWSQVPRQWGTEKTTTDTTRPQQQAEEPSEAAHGGVVFIVAPTYQVASIRTHPLHYGLGLSKMCPHLFVLEAPTGLGQISIIQQSTRVTEVDSSALRGVFAMKVERRLLFSETVEVRTKTLRRWKPQIIIDRRTLERDDA
jgi:hypothetical protein